MNQAPPQVLPFFVPPWQLTMLAIASWLCVAVWLVVVGRLRRGFPVLPYQPRREVPWGGIDVATVLVVCVAVLMAVALLAELILGPEVIREPMIYNVDKANAAHMIARLLTEASPWIVLLCSLSAAVVAPIAEEFFFRVLLQGWLEAAQRRWRRNMPTLRRFIPRAVGPIVLTSILFGMMHFRIARPMRHLNYHIYQLIAGMVASLVIVAVAIGLLRYRAGATAADLGWVREKFFADARLGLVAFAGLGAPIYAMQLALATLLPEGVAPDPITLFFFALALGALYYRTHRVVPAIVLHMALNITSLAMALPSIWR